MASWFLGGGSSFHPGFKQEKMAKYFHIENVNREVAGVVFEMYDIIGGCPMGIHKSEDEKEIADLTAVANNPASGVTTLTEAEYETLGKKKRPGSQGSPNWNQPAPQGTAMKGAGRAIVVENPTSLEAPAKSELTAEDALAVQAVPIKEEKILAKPTKKITEKE